MTSSLTAFAERVRDDSFFLASALSDFAASERLDRAAIAVWLGRENVDLDRLALCRRPRSDPAGFQEDVNRIAAHFDIDVDRLAEMVRHADVLTALRRGMTGQRIVAAARDAEAMDALSQVEDEQP